MTQQMKNVIVIGKHYFQESVNETMHEVAVLLQALNVNIFIGEQTAKCYTIPHQGILSATQVNHHDIELAIICGGDGTILKSARHLCGKGIPIVGINNGRLGFLSDINLAEFQKELPPLLHYEGIREERFFLYGKVEGGNKIIHEDISLNDIYLNKSQSGRLAEFEVFVDDLRAYSIRSDGIIISTPTGSTGYSLSAGSNVIHPGTHCIGMTPLNPHSLSVRPIIINDTSRILIRSKVPGIHVHFDGQNNLELNEEGEYLISIARHQETITFLHPKGYNYFRALKEKFS